MSGHHHRPTLKQQNKSFKSKHSTKSSLKAASKGRLTPAASTTASHAFASQSSASRVTTAATKRARQNTAHQKRDAQRLGRTRDARVFQTTAAGGCVPRVVVVVPLHRTSSCVAFTRAYLVNLGLDDRLREEIEAQLTEVGTWVVDAPRFKTSLHIIHLPPVSLYATLDAALVADYVVLLLSSEHEVEEEGERVLRCLQGAVGGAQVVAAVQSPPDAPMTPQERPMVIKSLHSFTTYFFPSLSKIHVAPGPGDRSPSNADGANLARALCEGVPALAQQASTTTTAAAAAAADKGRGRDGRAWLVAEEHDMRQGESRDATAPSVFWQADPASSGEEHKGTLYVTGTIRGGRLSADRLVHIPGWGDYAVDRIAYAPLTRQTRGGAARPATIEGMEQAPSAGQTLSEPTEEADTLVAFNEADDMLMGNEQTGFTAEELARGDAYMDNDDGSADRKRVKRVPKGTSAYQAAWIIDEEEDDEFDDGDDEDDDEMDHAGGEAEFGGIGKGFGRARHDEETEEVELDERATEADDYDEELDDDEEERQLAEYQAYKSRSKEHDTDLAFPDEVDTPRNVAARERFARYRGLQSFRTSPWDPYENLPVEYGRIFRFDDYERSRRVAVGNAKIDGVPEGVRVLLSIRNVEKAVADERVGLPLVVHGLMQHEHKQTVLHFVVQRNTEYEEPVRAKDPLVLCVGPRRYTVRPVYSQHTRGGGKGVNNVHKSEKFLRHGEAVVATTYGPAILGKQSCLLLRESENPTVPHLVAMGSFLNPDHERIVAKRIVLTGHPFKVHVKTATVRYMFFNRDDIEYFAPIELYTKYGRTGHIKEALGTHGYFKAHFDGPIQQMDTVCMSLYKRQFPKQAEIFRAPLPTITEKAEGMDLE
ncbi:ribosome biogenesis protein tsr1 [Naganishia albida]|nr:ribosome biogenesis protein tsr1 [Naganishia albida]